MRIMMTSVAVGLLAATAAGLGVPASAASAAPTAAAEAAVSPTGSGWQPPVNVGGSMDAVSCSGSRFCMAVTEDGQALSYDGSSWSAPVTVDPGAEVSAACSVTRTPSDIGPGGPGAGSATFEADSCWQQIGNTRAEISPK